MATEQAILDRLNEMGIPPQASVEISKFAQQNFLAGRGALLSVVHGPRCKDCGFPHQVAVFYIHAKKMPTWLASLLQESAARSRKKV